MREIKVKIIDSVHGCADRFKPFIGNYFIAYDQIDNKGDLCLISPSVPFVFIPANICKLILNKHNTK